MFAPTVGAQAPLSLGLESYTRAREVLRAGIEAHGGLDALRSVKTVRRDISGRWYGSGQSLRPYSASAPTLNPPPSNERDQITSFIDYAGGRWRDQAFESNGIGDAVTRVNAVDRDHGFETITFNDEKPFYRPFTAQDLPSLRVRNFRRHPEGALLSAFDRPEALEWVGGARDTGTPQRVISFTDAAGTRVLLYFDEKTGLLAKSETLRSHALAGDSSAEIIYDDYRAVENLRLPFRYVDRVAGVPTEEHRVTSIELNVSSSEDGFRPPREFALVASDPSEPVVEKLGDGLYLLRGPYNTLFAELSDHVMVFEAPVSSRYSEACLTLIRETVPHRPMRYVVSTHFHYDHVAGVRPYIAEGVAILTTPDARGVIEQVAHARHTMHPDALSANPRPPRIETVAGRRVFEDPTNRVELYDFGPTKHVAQLIVAYFPRQRVLFVADLWDIMSVDLVIAGTDAVNLAARIQQFGLNVDRIIPVHGVPGTGELLQQALAVRAKYLK